MFVVALAACGTHGFSGDDHDASENPDATTPSDGAPSVDSPFGDVSAVDAPAPGSAEVFAHSPDTLFRLDPTTKALTTVGAFTGCSQVTDIALDKSSTMYATTLDGLYRVDRTTAHCTQIATGTFPNSLSFVPAGTLDPNVEELVGFVGDQYVRIDTTTGNLTTIGALGSGYTSSGDIVSVENGGTYLTVKGGPDSCDDCLVQVDPKTGAFLLEWGALGHADVFGIAFWGGDVYGFDAAGEVFEVHFNGLAIQTNTINVPNAPPGLEFFGAGSTTVAPLTTN
jgi:hypothetical protein